MKLEITKEELKSFPVRHFEGKVHYTKNEQELMAIWDDFFNGSSVFGIDTETRPAFKKGQRFPTSIVQVCNGHEVVVCHLEKGVLPRVLRELLENDSLIKAGIAIDDDIKELRWTNPGLQDHEVYDLSQVARSMGFVSFGAKRLTALLLGFTVSKGQRTTDWSKAELSEAQIRYAATDAWICNLIYDKLLALDGQ